MTGTLCTPMEDGGRGVLLATLGACEPLYAGWPGVVGISVGPKLRNGREVAAASIQFYVERKQRSSDFALPAHVPACDANGSALAGVWIPTDVVEVGRVEAACAAGSTITRVGSRGTITLIFSDAGTGPGAVRRFALTCGHVVGDLTQRRPVGPNVWSSCCPARVPIGKTVASSTRNGLFIDYDIALVRLEDGAASSCALGDRRTRYGTTLTGFYPPDRIGPGTFVSCDFPVSNVRSTTVASHRGTVQMVLGSRVCTVRNAFTLRARVMRGDSGGLLFNGDRAVGILFGRSEKGFGWFHPLRDAVDYLAGLPGGQQFQVFPN
jgi:hypothetical protein